MHIKRKLAFLSFFFISSFAVLPHVFAHGGACKADREKFCSSAKGGEGFKCLKAHEKDLAPECQAKLVKMKERHEAFQKDCGEDVKKLCPNAERGRPTKECLRQNETKLSNACQERLHRRAHAPAMK